MANEKLIKSLSDLRLKIEPPVHISVMERMNQIIDYVNKLSSGKRPTIGDFEKLGWKEMKSGSMDFIENLLPRHWGCYHFDSHDDVNGTRFQGVFYSKPSNREINDCTVINDPPMAVIKACRDFRTSVEGNMVVWTIWFEDDKNKAVQ